MKALLISMIALSTLLLAWCTTKKSTTSVIPEDAKWTNVAVDHAKNIDDKDTMKMDHTKITSEEQFIAEMIPHHQEAVDTSKVIVANWETAVVKNLAQAIIDWQSSEITMLKGWLASQYPNSTYKSSYMAMMRSLSNLTDHELEDTYMEDMVKHHEAAIQMAKQVLDITQKPEIVKFANDVITTQSTEIAEFKKLLAAKDRH